MTQDFAKLFQSMIEQGQTMARAFTPSAFGTIDPKAFEAMFPAMPKDMLEMFFGKTFNPEGLDARTQHKVEFFTKQFTDALSPTNFALTNPEVLRAVAETKGENLVKGLENLLADLEKAALPKSAENLATATRGVLAIATYLDQLMAGANNQPLRLLGQSGRHFRMRMTKRTNSNATAKIKIPPTIHIPDFAARSVRQHQIKTPVCRHHITVK